MIQTYDTFQQMINSPVRQIKARVELYEGSTLLNTFSHNDRLISFEVQRAGEGKFFGFGICQRLNVKLIDTNRELNITTANIMEVVMGVENDYDYFLPVFKVSEVHRDETTNELSITAYDWLYEAANYTVSDLGLPQHYTINTMASYAAAFLGLNLLLEGLPAEDKAFYTYYPNGANLDGTETVRSILDAIAEATQTIYFVNNQWELVFKRLREDAVLVVDKERYFNLSSKTNRRLSVICHATELGDNVSAGLSASGSTQYVRDNPLWDMREDIADLVNNALAAVGGMTFNQFEMQWRGNFLVELGDCIGLVTKDNETVFSFLLDDTITYNGTYSQKSQWNYTDNEAESESNPTTLGDAIKQTFARVDKANKQIELVASEAEANTDSISSLLINTESITASISNVEQQTSSTLEGIKEDLDTINKKVSSTMTAEEIRYEIESEIENGVNKVVTNTGFVFDDTGLRVSKSGTEMETQITEDGMVVYKNNQAVLTANNCGVDAVNLSASTYLIIGTNSRFEDYGNNRTGCFWIGEVSN